MTTISTTELHQRLDDPHLTIVDVRPLVAYNGWHRGGDARGGHVPGAVAFPVAWIDTVDEAEIERLLDSKGVTAGREIVVYGDGDVDAAAFVTRLGALGIDGARILEGGAPAWAADEALPLERLPNYDKLVHIAWLREVLDGGRPEAAPNGQFLLFHVNFGVPEEYAEGHIPGALFLDTNWLEDPADWNRRSPEAIDAALRGLGITQRHDGRRLRPRHGGRRQREVAGPAGRADRGDPGAHDPALRRGRRRPPARWRLRLVGPGRQSARDRAARRRHRCRRSAPRCPLRPEVIVDIDEAKEIIADPAGAALVSVRTWREHIGNVSGYNYIGPAGRIKGDVWGNCGTDAYHMQHYRNVDNTMRAYPEIAANWDEAGITPDKWVAFYCGTGWRASETWFYAYLQGWQRIAVYDGGWFEWSQDPINNPIEVGLPVEAAEGDAA